MGKQHQESVLLETARVKLSPPPFYTVVLLNDDFTPMDFVIHVLQRYFMMEYEKAEQVMWQVHQEGKGICGIFPRDIAETKVAQVSACAREHKHPLICIMEKNV